MQPTQTDQAWRSRTQPDRAARDAAPRQAPLALIIEDGEWAGRSVEAALAANGYRIRRAYSGQDGIAYARALDPDAIFVDARLHDMSGLDICRGLSADPLVGATTPLVMITAHTDDRRSRIDALLAGAWDFVKVPSAIDELTAKLETWTRAKRAADDIRAAGLIDHATGLYNLRGLLQRAGELAAEAARYPRPIACVAFMVPHEAEDTAAEPAAVARACNGLRSTLRACDVLGRVARAQFAVLAPATDAAGAQRVAERGLQALDGLVGAGRAAHNASLAHAGYCAVPDVRATPIEPEELLGRATNALQLHRAAALREDRIREYRAS